MQIFGDPELFNELTPKLPVAHSNGNGNGNGHGPAHDDLLAIEAEMERQSGGYQKGDDERFEEDAPF